MSGLPDTRAVSISTAGFEDGLGRRSVRFDREVGGMLECLHLRPELWAFETSLRERADAIALLEDERFVRVRSIERGPQGLTVVSELVAGQRLSDLIDVRQRVDSAAFGVDAAFGFLLQVLPALSTLHTLSFSHGTVAPGRILITAASQIVLLDAIYGAALERLNLSRNVMWRDLELLAPPFAGAPRFDPQTDVTQAAFSALMLAVGRPLEGDGDPAALGPLVIEVRELAEIRAGRTFATRVQQFFAAALPLNGRVPSRSADEAAAEIAKLADMIGEEGCHTAFGHFARFDAPMFTASPLEDGVDEDEDAPKEVEPVVATRPAEAAPAPPPAAVAVPSPVVPPLPVPQIAPVPAVQPAPPVSVAPAVQPPPPVSVAPAVQPPPPVSVAPAIQPPPVPSPVPVPVIAPIAPIPVAPPSKPIGIAPPPQPQAISVAPAAPLRVRNEPPAGYTPARAEKEEPVRALPFVDRAPVEEPRRFPWKLAAAAVIVIALGTFAGRSYLQEDAEPAAVAEVAKPVEAPPAAPVSADRTGGGLTVDTQPAGAKVSLDGKDVGITPLKLEDVPPGRHTVVVTTGTATIRRTVRVEAGRQLALDIPIYSGWVVVFSPIPLDIASGGATLGNTETGRIILPPGRHSLTLTNKELGYSETRAVEIFPGEERPLNIEPKAFVNVNAHPWAEVWVDGKKAGDTPIANLPVLLGTRVFVFKHPQYGERRVTTTITSKPEGLSVDLTKS